MKSILNLTILFSMGLLLSGCATPSVERAKAIYKTFNDYALCSAYFGTFGHWYGAARSQEFRYEHYKRVVGEKERRELDCYIFPELKDEEPYLEERIKLYEEQGGW